FLGGLMLRLGRLSSRGLLGRPGFLRPSLLFRGGLPSRLLRFFLRLLLRCARFFRLLPSLRLRLPLPPGPFPSLGRGSLPRRLLRLRARLLLSQALLLGLLLSLGLGQALGLLRLLALLLLGQFLLLGPAPLLLLGLLFLFQLGAALLLE